MTPEDQDNFGGKLDVSGPKGAKPKTQAAIKPQPPASMSLKNFFKPQHTCDKAAEDVEMPE